MLPVMNNNDIEQFDVYNFLQKKDFIFFRMFERREYNLLQLI